MEGHGAEDTWSGGAMGKKGPGVERPWGEGGTGWGAWVEGHRVEEAWPTFSNLTSPSRESVPLPLSQIDFFPTQALIFSPII